MTAQAKVRRIADLALDAIEHAVAAGDVDAAFRWLRIVPITDITEPPTGPMESIDVVEMARNALPPLLQEMLSAGKERSTADAEDRLFARLREARRT